MKKNANITLQDFTVYTRLAPGLLNNTFKLLVCVNWCFFDDLTHFFMAIQYSFHMLREDWGCPGCMLGVY